MFQRAKCPEGQSAPKDKMPLKGLRAQNYQKLGRIRQQQQRENELLTTRSARLCRQLKKLPVTL